MRIRLLVPTTTTDECRPARRSRSQPSTCGRVAAACAEARVAIAVEHGAIASSWSRSIRRASQRPRRAAFCVASQTPTTIEGARERITDQVNRARNSSRPRARPCVAHRCRGRRRHGEAQRAVARRAARALADARRSAAIGAARAQRGRPRAAKAECASFSRAGAAPSGAAASDSIRRPRGCGDEVHRSRPVPACSRSRPTPIVIARAAGHGDARARRRSRSSTPRPALARLANAWPKKRWTQHRDHRHVAVSWSPRSRQVRDRSRRAARRRSRDVRRTRHPRSASSGGAAVARCTLVESSLAGEDWTDLFSSAIDLADTDAAIRWRVARRREAPARPSGRDEPRHGRASGSTHARASPAGGGVGWPAGRRKKADREAHAHRVNARARAWTPPPRGA